METVSGTHETSTIGRVDGQQRWVDVAGRTRDRVSKCAETSRRHDLAAVEVEDPEFQGNRLPILDRVVVPICSHPGHVDRAVEPDDAERCRDLEVLAAAATEMVRIPRVRVAGR